MREHSHWQIPLPPNHIRSHFDEPPSPPSPLSANIITECPRTSIQIFSHKFFCTDLSKVKLEILWNSSTIFRSTHRRCSIKTFLKILQYSQKNTCVGVSFLINLQPIRPVTLLIRGSNTIISLWISRNFWEHLFWRTFRRSH